MQRPMSRSRSIALGLLAPLLVANAARSSTISYHTSGAVLPFGGQTGPSAVSFEGVPGPAVITDSSPFTIGDFQVTPSADGSTTRYLDTPFLIQLSGTRSDVGYPSIRIFDSILIFGRLNGSVSNTSPSTIVATVDAVQPGVVPTSGQYVGFVQILPFDPSALKITRDTPLASGGSGTSLIGHIEATPEPGTLAIFGAVTVFLGLRLRRPSAAHPRSLGG